MKKIVLGAIVALISTSCIYNLEFNTGKKSHVVCNGPVETRTFDLAGFNSITVNGSADVEIFQADSFSFSVTANAPVFDHLDYRVEDGVLILETKEHVKIKAKTFDITIFMPELTTLTVNGAGDVDLKNGYASANGMDIVINGAGDIDITGIAVPSLGVGINGAGDVDINDMNVDYVSVRISGAGDVDLSGKAGSANFSVSGAGDIDARSLECTDVKTSKSGLASIRLK